MPKTPPPSRSGSRRTTPTKVSKPFPWGTAVGSAVLAVFLVGLLVYAAMNTGGGISDVVRNPDGAIKGVSVADPKTLTQNHVTTRVDYPQTPPNGGDHSGTPQTCAVYDAPIAPEHAVHSLEHGAVWITYNDKASKDDVDALRRKAERDPYILMSPVPEQKAPINLSAWGRRLSLESAGDERVDQFLRGYVNGPQTPESGAACQGNTTTGPLNPPAAAPSTPSTGQSPAATVTVPPQTPAPSGSPAAQ